MRKSIIRTLLTLVIVLSAFSASTQYNREYFFWMGRQFMLRNNYPEAIRILNSLLRFDAEAYEGYFLRGIAKYNLDDLLGADTDFTLAIEHNPVFTNAYKLSSVNNGIPHENHFTVTTNDGITDFGAEGAKIIFGKSKLIFWIIPQRCGFFNAFVEKTVRSFAQYSSISPDRLHHCRKSGRSPAKLRS